MKLISSREYFRNELIALTVDEAIDPEGHALKRAIVWHAGSAVVMPVDEKRRVLLVRQYRLPARQYVWELPAGKIDAGETALRAAKRELKEETGLKAAKWKKLVSFYSSPGFLAEQMTIYLAEGLKEGKASPHGDERITMKWFTVRELETMILAGEIIDAKTIVGLYARKLRK